MQLAKIAQRITKSIWRLTENACPGQRRSRKLAAKILPKTGRALNYALILATPPVVSSLFEPNWRFLYLKSDRTDGPLREKTLPQPPRKLLDGRLHEAPS